MEIKRKLNYGKNFKDMSLEKFNKVYEELGVEFDSYAGESFYTDRWIP